MTKNSSQIIFVYNANKGFFNGLMDSAHKLLSPNTYACDLCAITHGMMGAKKQWAAFVESLDSHVSFYHKNDLPEELKNYALPVILIKNDNGVKELVSSKMMGEIKDVETLMKIIRKG